MHGRRALTIRGAEAVGARVAAGFIGGVKLLLDENLSPRLVQLLARDFPGCSHVDAIGLHGKPDVEIWGYAREHGFVIVSKDDDFRQLSFLHGAPPTVGW